MAKTNIIIMVSIVALLSFSCDTNAQKSKPTSLQTKKQECVQTFIQNNETDTTEITPKKKFIRIENGFKETNFESTNFSSALPTMDIAFDVAFTIMSGIYGKEHCMKYYPYKGYLLNNSVWIFYGTMPEVREGGFPYIEINKHDGRVLRLTHYK